MEVDILFKIAGIGILVAVISQVLSRSGKEEIAMITSLAGLIIVLAMVIDMIADLFQSVRSVFMF